MTPVINGKQKQTNKDPNASNEDNGNANRKRTNSGTKGILKPLKEETRESNSSFRTNLNKDKRKSIKWDELNVTATLHPVGKDYGHMKIEEVPTPYERDEAPFNPTELARRLEQEVALRRSSSYSTSSDLNNADLSEEERKRKKQFQQRRKDHYNEYKEAKLRMSQISDSDDEEEDSALIGASNKTNT